VLKQRTGARVPTGHLGSGAFAVAESDAAASARRHRAQRTEPPRSSSASAHNRRATAEHTADLDMRSAHPVGQTHLSRDQTIVSPSDGHKFSYRSLIAAPRSRTYACPRRVRSNEPFPILLVQQLAKCGDDAVRPSRRTDDRTPNDEPFTLSSFGRLVPQRARGGASRFRQKSGSSTRPTSAPSDRDTRPGA